MQPRSGGKGDRFLLVVVLNADGDANVALLVVALDHHAYIRPDAILTHVAVDIRFNIPRDISQNRAQERILIVVPGSNGNSQIISHWVCVVGIRADADPANLKESDFYALDPARVSANGTLAVTRLLDGTIRTDNSPLKTAG